MPDPVPASRAICDAAYNILNGASGLAGIGKKERVIPWQDSDLPRWSVAWEDEQILPLSGNEYECQLVLYFIAHTQGDDAAAKADQLRLAAQKALMDDGKLGGLVTRLHPNGADPERDDSGRAVSGTIRLAFKVTYETNKDGVLLSA